ncbi:unnamed protein product [Moneuplotes crassus]|uniref:Penicillin amidase n=1 Tax=Euplotes crassus TaxID=5936 RepID=A0AAD1XT35_EUPCR|nr:unnamed protein product [Moneuplotes crassus]
MSCTCYCTTFGVIVVTFYAILIYISESTRLSGTFQIRSSFDGNADVFEEVTGVYRIYAENKLAGAYANGYTTASNRLWQMEYLRRLAQGRLSEIFGQSTVPIDEGFRILGFTSVCEEELEYLEDYNKEFFDAYFQGVNDYAHTHSSPLQFHFFGINYENYTIVDSCTLTKLMGFMLSGNWGDEVVRDYLSAITQDEELVQGLYSYSDSQFDEFSTTILNEQELIDIGLNTSEKLPQVENLLKGNITNYVDEVVSEMIEEIESVKFDGSNAWVISGEHTETGMPIISNDPHLGNSLPSIWYYSHIEYPDGTFISGATVPGLPFFAIFTTEKIAFTITAIAADSSDVYKEKIKKNKYEYEGKLYPLNVRKEIIKVKNSNSIVLKVKSTRHGPLLNPKSIEALNNVAKGAPIKMPKGDYSYKWGGIIPQDNQAFKTLSIINDVKSAKELLNIIKQSNGVNTNIVFCDNLGEYGNIGFAPYGSYPKRTNDAGHRISRGWINENEWDEYIPGDEKPYLFNPKKGYIVMANNPISNANTKSQISTHSLGTARAYRITELIEDLIKTKSGSIGYKDMINILSDVKDPYAEQKKQYFINITRQYMKKNNIENQGKEEIMDMLDKWDGTYKMDMKEPVYFTLWEFFFRSTFMTEQFKNNEETKAKMFSNGYFEGNFVQLFRNISSNPDHFAKYCRKYGVIDSENCPHLLYLSLNNTIKYTRAFHNNNTVWGDVHTMRYPNIPFTKSILKWFFDREVRASGSSNTVSVAGIKFGKFEGKNNENIWSLLFSPKKEFPSAHSGNLKFISLMNGTVYYSLDTGVSESLFSGLYFNMNPRHMMNKLFRADFPREEDFLPMDMDPMIRFEIRKTDANVPTEDL